MTLFTGENTLKNLSLTQQTFNQTPLYKVVLFFYRIKKAVGYTYCLITFL